MTPVPVTAFARGSSSVFVFALVVADAPPIRAQGGNPAEDDPREGDGHPALRAGLHLGRGPRVDDAGDGRIPGFSYSAPFEDLRLKK